MDAGLRRAALGLTLALLAAACAGPTGNAPAPSGNGPAISVSRGAESDKRQARSVKARVPLPRPRPAQPPPSVSPPPQAEGTAGAAKPVPAAVPAKAVRYAPVLVEKQRARWPEAPAPWTLGGLVEQESCITLKHRRCWDPRAELKTSREYGFGLGQITVAYNADSSVRFDKFAELKAQYASLHAWRWAERYDAGYQLTAIVEMTHGLWRRVPPAATADDRWAFTDASYNGGLASLLQDRRLCANSQACDPQRWFGHVETHSLKSRKPQPAYGGRSWFEINRGHVRNVLKIRRAKYRVFWEAS